MREFRDYYSEIDMKIRKITDWTLVPLFLLTLWSGIKLHVTDYSSAHEDWHTWAVVHSIAGVLMTVFIIMHIRQHWKWYKAIRTPLKLKKARNRRRAVLALTVLFATVIATGIGLLLFIDGADSHTGLLHFWIGLLASLFAIQHILKRTKQLIHQ